MNPTQKKEPYYVSLCARIFKNIFYRINSIKADKIIFITIITTLLTLTTSNLIIGP